jgi:alanine-synthesizing transaminase
VLVSYPHNPTTAVATREDMQRLVDLAREREFLLVHDFAYADVAFDGTSRRPSSQPTARRSARSSCTA